MAKTPPGASASARKKTPATSKTKSKSSGSASTASKSKKTPGAQTKSKSPSNDTQDENIVTSSEIALIKDGDRQFYSSIKVIPRRDKFRKSDPLSQPTFNSNASWCITIGDLVCVQHPSSHSLNAPFTTSWRPCQILSLFRERSNEKGSKLSTRKKKWGAMKMEVRWFYRIHDLDDRTLRYEKKLLKKQSSNKKKKGGRRNDGEEEEFFETGHVEVLDASVLLGRLVLKHNHDVGKVKNGAANYSVPTVVKFCHRYYLHKEQDVFDIFDWGNMLTRGLECSEMNENVTMKALKCLSLTTSRSGNTKEIGDDPLVLLPCHTETVKQKELILFYTSCTLAYPWSQMKHSNLLCHPEKRDEFPKWELCVGDIIAVHSESTPPSGNDDIQGRDKWYPYRVPWSHAQVISIYRATVAKSDTLHNERVSVGAESITVELRWFPRVSEAMKEGHDKKMILKMLEQISDDGDRMCEEILEGEQFTTIDCSSILGPVFIDDGNDQNCAVSPCFLPKNRRTVSEILRCDKGGVPALVKNWIYIDPLSRVHRGSQVPEHPKNKQKKAILLEAVLKVRDQRAKQLIHEQSKVAIEGEIVESEPVQGFAGDIAAEPGGHEQSPHKKRELFSSGFNVIDECKKLRTSADGEPFHKAPRDAMTSESVVNRTLQENLAGEEEQLLSPELRVSCHIKPFHVDVSALKSFYEVICIIPPLDSYDDRFFAGKDDKQASEEWKVKLGDTVALEVEQDPKDSSSVRFPFNVSWAPAEVVSIYQVHKTKESCVNLREQMSNQAQHKSLQLSDDGCTIMIEVRWLYRSYEIPGAPKKKSSADNGELEEVFETDQIDSCSADSILSPIQLHDVSKKQPVDAFGSQMGMPCIHYQCSRLWSIHRRSFVPSGSLNNRVSRGRMYSAYKSALEILNQLPTDGGASFTGQQREISWKESFQAAIQQLSLAEAAQDAQDNGMVLACREKERARIKSFLTKAIRGSSSKDVSQDEDETMNLQSSMFIAGPPGTGKTASVRSVIAELQKEQHAGLVPEFNFIALNGMELRHPFDSYVKFWEALSGTRKERLPAGEAANKLEHYFCGNQDDDFGKDDAESIKRNRMSEKPVTVLMMDEIDYIVTKKETLIYNFFDWPLRATTARLVVVGISNTIHLPETLQPKLQSRIGGNRCHFIAYNVQDTMTILKTRLGMLGDSPGYPVFEEDAIKFAARKTANLSGDIRKAFHMCKAAAERVLEDCSSGKRQLKEGSRPRVRISDVQKGSKDMLTSVILMAIKCSTAYEALLLISIGALKRTREDSSFTARELLTKIESIANASGEPRYMNARLAFADVLGILNRLGGAGIIQLTSCSSSPWPLVQTTLHTFEILACYRDTRHSKLAEKHLASDRLF